MLTGGEFRKERLESHTPRRRETRIMEKKKKRSALVGKSLLSSPGSESLPRPFLRRRTPQLQRGEKSSQADSWELTFSRPGTPSKVGGGIEQALLIKPAALCPPIAKPTVLWAFKEDLDPFNYFIEKFD